MGLKGLTISYVGLHDIIILKVHIFMNKINMHWQKCKTNHKLRCMKLYHANYCLNKVLIIMVIVLLSMLKKVFNITLTCFLQFLDNSDGFHTVVKQTQSNPFLLPESFMKARYTVL